MKKLNDGGFFSLSENTGVQFSREIPFETIDHNIEAIVHYLKCNGQKACYVSGSGGHPKSTYKKVSAIAGVEVIFSRHSSIPSNIPIPLSFLFKFLAIIIPSCEGLVRIDQIDSLPLVFKMLSEQSMGGVYVFDKKHEKDFVSAAREQNPTYHDFNIKQDPSYLIYIVDTDNSQYETGIVEIVSLGNEIYNNTILE